MWELDHKRKLSAKELMLLNYGAGEDSWESLGLKGDQTNQSSRKSVLNIHWKDWCWNWSYNTLATWCEELTQRKRSWCWEILKAGGEGDNRGWDGGMASLTQRTWIFDQASGVGDGQGRLACCSPWDLKESDTSEQLNSIVHCMCIPHYVYPFICQWTLGLLPPFGYDE